MRLPGAGPRTLLRLAVLVSLPSLLMFLYIFTQMLPMAIMHRNLQEQGILPIVLIKPEEDIDKDLSDMSQTMDPRYVIGDAIDPRDLDLKNNILLQFVTNPLTDIDYPSEESKLWQNSDQISNNSDDNPSELNNNSINSNTLNPHELNLESNGLGTKDRPSIPGYEIEQELPTILRDAPNKPSSEELEDYLMKNYQSNKAKGFSDFSLRLTEEMIERGPLQLPDLLPNLEVPCWVEEVPVDFTYKNNIYHCHINNRRIKDSLDIMYAYHQVRQHYTGFKWRVRCLPSFYLIGVAKCGTTDLFEALTRHPQVLKPALKEPEYWPYLRFGINDLIINITCAKDKGKATFADYMDTYDLTSELVKESIRKDDSGNLTAKVFFGDYSTHTFIDIFDWNKTLDAPDKINAHHIYNVWPKSKFILILRDPVDRAYSRYKMRMGRQNGGLKGTPTDFHKRILRQVQTTNECMAEHSRRYCVYKAKYGVGLLGTNALLNTGLYTLYMRDWLSIFPRQQILIILFEEYINNRPETIDMIIKFLGMDSLSVDYRDIIHSMPVANAGPEIGGILPETREFLQDFYRPYNKELMDLLGDEKYTWGY